MHHLAPLQQFTKPRLGYAGWQSSLRANRLAANILHVGHCEHRGITWLVRNLCNARNKTVSNNLDVIICILLWSTQVHITRVTSCEGGCPLQEIILALPTLNTDWRGRAIVVGKMSELAHKVTPINASVLTRIPTLLTCKLCGPQEIHSLLRDVIACRANGICELRLVHNVAPLRVQFAKRSPKGLTIVKQRIDQCLGDMAHMALLCLVVHATNIHFSSKHQICKLLKGESALAILVNGTDQHPALMLVNLDTHLVKHLLQVLGEGKAGLRQRAILEDAHQARPARITLLHDFAQPTHA
mmetsp:Transcript_110338/g.276240  ORF Transcript_110338/g.276240 Transcript_110338/m.276240 type:complete len:299 (-) Transcript_110338:825-1721(-)